MAVLLPPEILESEFKCKIEKIGSQFFDSPYRSKAANPSFFSLMTFRIQQGYWQRTYSYYSTRLRMSDIQINGLLETIVGGLNAAA